jgi:hypothetical protein
VVVVQAGDGTVDVEADVAKKPGQADHDTP